MKLYLVLLTLTILGCGSSVKNSEDLDSSNQQGLVNLSESSQKKDTSSSQPLPSVAADTLNDVQVQESSSVELDRAIQKQDDRGIAIFSRKILIQSPLDAKALNALALYHFKKGELKAAEALLSKAISANDQISMLFSNLGIVLQSLKDESGAVKAYRQALKVDPFNPIAAANVGAYYAQVKDYKKAQVALEIAVEKGQRDWRTLNNYGVTLMALGQYPFAETQLKKSSELQPQNTAVLLNYAILLVDHLGKPAQGLDIINRIRFMGPSPDMRKKISELENKAKSLK